MLEVCLSRIQEFPIPYKLHSPSNKFPKQNGNWELKYIYIYIKVEGRIKKTNRIKCSIRLKFHWINLSQLLLQWTWQSSFSSFLYQCFPFCLQNFSFCLSTCLFINKNQTKSGKVHSQKLTNISDMQESRMYWIPAFGSQESRLGLLAIHSDIYIIKSTPIIYIYI